MQFETTIEQVTYEVYLNPEQTKLSDATRAAQLDARLAKLEKLVGTESLARSSAVLKDDDADITLSTAINKMSQRIDVVSEDGVDTIRSRLEAVLKLADEVGEKKSAAEKAQADEQSQRVSTLVGFGGCVRSLCRNPTNSRSLRRIITRSTTYACLLLSRTRTLD